MFRKFLVYTIILLPLITYQGCKKQPRCGCGKDVIFELDDAQVRINFNEATNTVIFTNASNTYATYYFCNPADWIDSLKKLDVTEYLLLDGKVYYECNYLYNSSNSYYQYPPVYQVEVSGIREDNYGKK